MALEPGIHDDLPAEAYHADPALGHSGAVTLMDECPALYRHARDAEDEEATREMEFGRAAHLLVLQPDLFTARTQIIAGDNYKKKLAQELRDAARAEGLIPLLSREVGMLAALDDAVKRDPDAAPYLRGGIAERSVVWYQSGVRCKARFDYLAGDALVDFKSALSVHPKALGNAAYRDHWDTQDPWYRTGAAAVGLMVRDFVFIAVRKKPPYLVQCHRLTPADREWGALHNAAALARFKECRDNAAWPKYSTGVSYLELPRRAEFERQERLARGEFHVKQPRAADVERARDFLAPWEAA